MAQLWTQKRENTSGPKIQNIDAGELSLQKPTLIFLPGLFNTPKQPAMIRAGIGHLLGMLRSFGERNGETCEIHTVSYNGRRSNLSHFFNYNSKPKTYASVEAREFVNDYLMKHIARDVKIGPKGRVISGTAKPKKDIERAFQNLTFMAYSYGTVFSQEVYNASRDAMKKVGINERDSKYLLSRIHLVSVGCVSRPIKEKNRFTSICLVASNDFVSNLKRYVFWSLKEVFATVADNLKISPLSRRNLYITAPVKRRPQQTITTAEGKKITQNVKPLFPKWSPIASHHELEHYTTDQDDHNQFAKIVRYALVNCLRRTRALKGVEMIAPPRALGQLDGADAYTSRIDQAITPQKTR